jgi:hypothetical protein
LHRSLVVAALAVLAALPGLAPGAAAQDAPAKEPPAPAPAPAPPPEEAVVPDAAARAPLPPEPSAEVKKKVQAALKAWMANEPMLPDKARTSLQVKGDRSAANATLQGVLKAWAATIQPNHPLRLMAWWKARFEETQPSENRPTGIQKVDYVTRDDNGKDWTYALIVNVPKTYRASAPDVYPVIVTILDKEMAADAKKHLTAIYGKLLDSHIVVAAVESNLRDFRAVRQCVYYAHFNYKIDRDRVALDAVGKGTRFVEALSTSEVFCFQWNGVVFRSPVMTSPIAGNLDLYPCAVIEAPQPSAPAATAMGVIKSNCTALTVIPAGADADQKVRDWIAALPVRKVGNPAATYTAWFRSSGDTPKWGYWFLVDETYDSGAEAPIIRVKYSVDPKKNLVDIDATNLSRASILVNDEVLDLDQPVRVRVNGILMPIHNLLARDLNIMMDAINGLGTPPLGHRSYIITGVIPFQVTGDALIPKATRDALRAQEEERKRKADGAAELEKQAEEERKKAEEEAKNPKPPVEGPKPGEGPAPADGATVAWHDDLDKAIDNAKAEKLGKTVLVHFSDQSSERQADLNAALASEDARRRLLKYWCVELRADRDEASRVRLGALAESKDAKAPRLFLIKPEDGKLESGLAVTELKKEEVATKVLEFLGPPPAGAEKTTDGKSPPPAGTDGEKKPGEGEKKDPPPPVDPPKEPAK